MSIQDIQQNPQDTSNFYLANIYQATINPNVSDTLPTSPPPFSPPNYAVWVNALWFMTLVISLTCALLATLLQQWARRYLKVTQSRYSPHKRARIRSFFSEGVEKCLLPWAVETLPTLLHISLFLFFAGLVVFLCNVNMTVFKLVLSWVGACTALYGCITLMPIFRHDSPYHTPLSLPAWHIVTGIPYLVFRVLRRLTYLVCLSYTVHRRFESLEESYREMLVQGMQKTAEETALKSTSDIDGRAFMWTFDCLDEDHELERFFSGLPGLGNSKLVDNLLPSLPSEQKQKLHGALIGLLDRTFSSDLLLVPLKNRRALICAKAVYPGHIPSAFSVLDRILTEYQYSGPVATRIVNILRGWENNMDADDLLGAQAIISMTVVRMQPRDDAWYILASNALGVTEAALRTYAAHGNSLSLAILIHVVRQDFSNFGKGSWLEHPFSLVLEAASKFDIRDILPELQHEFCALWNQIVRQVRITDNRAMAFFTLGTIRNVYLALHQDTDCAPTRFSPSTGDGDRILFRPSSYPFCNIAAHHLDSMPHIHDNSTSTAVVLAVVPNQHNTTRLPFSLASLDPLPSSPNAPPRVDDSHTDAPPPLENNISLPVSFLRVDQATTERRRIPSGGLGVPSSPDFPSSASHEPALDHMSGPSLSLTLP